MLNIDSSDLTSIRINGSERYLNHMIISIFYTVLLVLRSSNHIIEAITGYWANNLTLQST